MSVRSFCGDLVAAIAALLLASVFLATTAQAQRSQADCAPGWVFANGQCQPPPRGNPGGQCDAACQATGQFNYCQCSVRVGCQGLGDQYACRLLQLSYSDPNTFQQIMFAQKACYLDRNQQACAFLQRYRGVYF